MGYENANNRQFARFVTAVEAYGETENAPERFAAVMRRLIATKRTASKAQKAQSSLPSGQEKVQGS